MQQSRRAKIRKVNEPLLCQQFFKLCRKFFYLYCQILNSSTGEAYHARFNLKIVCTFHPVSDSVTCREYKLRCEHCTVFENGRNKVVVHQFDVSAMMDRRPRSFEVKEPSRTIALSAGISTRDDPIDR